MQRAPVVAPKLMMIPTDRCTTSQAFAIEARNVVGMMPHPDRAWDHKLGSEDGKLLFGSLVEALEPVVSR